MYYKIRALLCLMIVVAIFSCDFKSPEEPKSSTMAFADLADEPGFSESHEEPRQITEGEILGKLIKIPVEGSKDATAYMVKNEKQTNKYLFVIHEWWGLNDHIKKEAEIWFKKLGDINVLALDLYDGLVAKTGEKAREYMQGAKEERIVEIIDAVIASLPNEAEIGTIGWCFGGGWSLKTAIRSKAKACVMYYGMPIENVEELKNLNSDVLFIYGKEDQWINEEVALKFQENMKNASRELKVLAYDADHAFANPSSERYLEQAAQDANQAAYDYLNERLN